MYQIQFMTQVSVMHVNTILWYQMWQLPFKAILADKGLLVARRYALERDMHHARSLDPACLLKSTSME